MPKYNSSFDLDPEDMDLIETALRSMQSRTIDDPAEGHRISALLGRLHNQKIFYRPAQGVYVGG
ncbi:MAG: hypothetical protein ACMVY4_16680 [Minwuia sp.]|uniref:hypothetical protein n=1 Tax=Minwuia sp. TaxID=2493630 RepID=UPI003A8B69CC